jgi:hypothetical protein
VRSDHPRAVRRRTTATISTASANALDALLYAAAQRARSPRVRRWAASLLQNGETATSESVGRQREQVRQLPSRRATGKGGAE